MGISSGGERTTEKDGHAIREGLIEIDIISFGVPQAEQLAVRNTYTSEYQR